MNSKIHINDNPFALKDGLLPPNLSGGTAMVQFYKLAEIAKIPMVQVNKIVTKLGSKKEIVKKLIAASFLDKRTQRNYLQSYEARLKKITAK